MFQKSGSPSPQQSSTRINTHFSNAYNMPPQRSFGKQNSGNRRLHGELSPAARASVISKFDAGVGTSELATEFSVTPKCVRDTLPRYRATGSNESRPRSGRLQKLTRHDIRILWRLRRKTPKFNTNHLLETPTQRRTTPALQSIDGYKTLVLRTSERRDDRILLAQPHKNGCNSAMNIETSTGVGPSLGSVTCSVQKGAGQNREWVSRYPWEKWKPVMIEARSTSRPLQQMV
jgi:hypothetical protein